MAVAEICGFVLGKIVVNGIAAPMVCGKAKGHPQASESDCCLSVHGCPFLLIRRDNILAESGKWRAEDLAPRDTRS